MALGELVGLWHPLVVVRPCSMSYVEVATVRLSALCGDMAVSSSRWHPDGRQLDQ